jgi:cytochrome c peroxidase
MRTHLRSTVLAACSATLLAACGDVRDPASPPMADLLRASTSSSEAALGGFIFNDANLSVNGRQSCSTCHEPSEGFAAPLAAWPHQGSVAEGAVPGRFGDRKPPTAAYATLTPRFSGGNNPTGGLFWDGRATGVETGTAAGDQALGPFLNPNEQALPDKACVIFLIQQSAYSVQFQAVYGGATIVFPAGTAEICGNAALAVGEHVPLDGTQRAAVNAAYLNVGRAIAAFEGTLNVFDSKLDRRQLNAQEQQGQKLFGAKGKCAQCHTAKGSQPVFTDFAFHNLGVPKNPNNPVYGWGTPATLFDPGLGGFTERSAHLGKFRTPTVRNVDLGFNRTFMHNGALVSLKQVVDFYNTRDALPRCTDEAILRDPATWGSFGTGKCWPAPEFAGTMDSKQMGKLGLTEAEVDAIVAFMKALTDGR